MFVHYYSSSVFDLDFPAFLVFFLSAGAFSFDLDFLGFVSSAALSPSSVPFFLFLSGLSLADCFASVSSFWVLFGFESDFFFLGEVFGGSLMGSSESL
jgi:hypothetical protein